MNPYEQITEAVARMMAAKTQQYQRELELRTEAVLLESDIILSRIVERLTHSCTRRQDQFSPQG
jgi:hypothetical protein